MLILSKFTRVPAFNWEKIVLRPTSKEKFRKGIFSRIIFRVLVFSKRPNGQ
jgi:hypothetical protein